jgi:hypothetical protein
MENGYVGDKPKEVIDALLALAASMKQDMELQPDDIRLGVRDALRPHIVSVLRAWSAWVVLIHSGILIGMLLLGTGIGWAARGPSMIQLAGAMQNCSAPVNNGSQTCWLPVVIREGK